MSRSTLFPDARPAPSRRGKARVPTPPTPTPPVTPAVAPSPPSSTAPASSSTPAPWWARDAGGEVDDNPDLRERVRTTAERRGYPALPLRGRPAERVAAGAETWTRFTGNGALADVSAVASAMERER